MLANKARLELKIAHALVSWRRLSHGRESKPRLKSGSCREMVRCTVLAMVCGNGNPVEMHDSVAKERASGLKSTCGDERGGVEETFIGFLTSSWWITGWVPRHCVIAKVFSLLDLTTSHKVFPLFDLTPSHIHFLYVAVVASHDKLVEYNLERVIRLDHGHDLVLHQS